ncbi:hypothetical protein LTR37_017665 [Vermiconidia calcicola]|uniref:Uncharacterized protein n=1 Tax=Vermiconidia calcicola TaxID=1690605 RepID=A0ACC3MJF7_9PEZI|nr:hypothetical protein LTR37_017665 [Vermiconidia calcicola]
MVGRDATNEVKASHSLETQHFMRQWEDFVPPLQGGKFKRRDEIVNCTESENGVEEEVQESSEEERSEEPSPIFEASEHRTASVRRRRGSDGAASDCSATSLDSLELENPAMHDGKQSPTDARIQEELQHDLDIFPSLDPITQATIIRKYNQLDARIKAADYTAYAIELTRYTLLALLSYFFLQKQYFILSATFLGMLWHQLVFTFHDAGHMGITHNYHTDTCIGILIADFLGGLSVCWWKQNHNVHHIVTNSAEHDPDIQHMSFFAITHRFFESLRSIYYDRIMTYDPFAKLMLKYQHYL